MAVPTTRSVHQTNGELSAAEQAAEGDERADSVSTTAVDVAAVAAEQNAEAAAEPEVTSGGSRSLDKSLVMGLAWTGGVKWATQIVSWCSTIIVARLLSPGDYGIMGMAMVYVNLVALINEFGLTAAILRNRDMSEHQLAQVGGFGVLLGSVFTVASILMAGPVAWFYSNPAVHVVVIILSFNFTLTAMGVLPRALMARDLEFRRLASIDGISSLIQIGVTIGLALLGARYFSLVFSSLIATMARAGLAVYWKRHKLAWPWPLSEIRKSIHVGWHVVMGRVAWYTYQNADFAIVGRVLGPMMLGMYTIGWEVATVPVERVSALVGQVTPSIFSTVQDDQAALRRYYLGVVGGIALLTFPAAIGIAMTADLLVPALLGAKWIPAIIPLQFLAGYAGIRSIDTVTPQILVFTGHSRASMWISIVAACVFPALFYLGTRWGAGGVAAMWVVAYPIVMIPAYRILFKALGLSPRAYFANLLPAISGTIIMALLLWLARPPLHHMLPTKLALVAEVLLGAVIYAAMLAVFHRDRLSSFVRLVKQARK
jgi:PST family polysaccharide transporter